MIRKKVFRPPKKISAKNVFCLAFQMLEVYELSLAHSVLKSQIILLATILFNM